MQIYAQNKNWKLFAHLFMSQRRSGWSLGSPKLLPSLAGTDTRAVTLQKEKRWTFPYNGSYPSMVSGSMMVKMTVWYVYPQGAREWGPGRKPDTIWSQVFPEVPIGVPVCRCSYLCNDHSIPEDPHAPNTLISRPYKTHICATRLCEAHRLWGQAWIWILAQFLTSCMTFCKWANVSVFWWRWWRSYLIGLQWSVKEKIHVQCWTHIMSDIDSGHYYCDTNSCPLGNEQSTALEVVEK